jgi:putative transposase
MVEQAADYHWASHHFHARGVNASLATPHEVYSRLAKSIEARRAVYRALFAKPQDHAMVENIRDSVQKELALGNDRFKREIEALYGRRVVPAKSGRPVRSE